MGIFANVAFTTSLTNYLDFFNKMEGPFSLSHFMVEMEELRLSSITHS